MTANSIAKIFNNDSSLFFNNGNDIFSICKENARSIEQDWRIGATKWIFSDGSSIVACGEEWGIGLTDEENCFCFERSEVCECKP